MTPRERLQWEQEINELSACDTAIEELVGRYCHPSKWPKTRQAMYPAKLQPESVPAEDPVERLATKMEYVSNRKSRLYLYQQVWFERLRAKLLPELRAFAELPEVGGAEAQAEDIRLRLRQAGGMPKKAMTELLQLPPKKLALHLMHDQLKKAAKAAKDGGSDEELRHVQQVLSSLKQLPESAPFPRVKELLVKACPDKLYKKFSERFERRVGAELEGTADKLAALTIFEVISETLMAAEGKVPAVSLGKQLGSTVLAQYERDALQFDAVTTKLHWHAVQEVREVTADEPQEAAATEEEVAHGESSLAEAEVDVPLPGGAADVDGDARDEWLARDPLDRQQSVSRRMAKRVAGMTSVRAANMELRRLRKSSEACAQLEAILPIWDPATRLRVGTYLMDRLEQVASLPPRFDCGGAVGGEAVGGEAVGGEAVGGEAVGGEAVGGEAVSGEVVGGEAVGGEAVGGEAVGGEAVGGEAVGGEVVGGLAALGASLDSSSPLAGGEAGGEAGVEAWEEKHWAPREEEMVKAFCIENEWVAGGQVRRCKYLKVSPQLGRLMTPIAMTPGNLRDRRSIHPLEFPMLVPPLAWSKPEGELPVGGCFHHSTQLVRAKCEGHHHQQELQRTPPEKLQPLFDALNALAACEWRVNRRMLDLALKLFEPASCPEGLQVGVSFLPDRADKAMPRRPESAAPVDEMLLQEWDWAAAKERFPPADLESWREWKTACAEARRHNANLHSQRCTARLQLDVARDLAERRFYFPYNVDFRGRAYPVSPYLSHIGDDLCRGLLLFGEAKPLGASGYRWLKIHLANLYGMDKLPLARREAWADEALGTGILGEVAREPLGEKAIAWWRQAENTLQAIAVATELYAASVHRPDGDAGPCQPERYLSSMPVHQDGSCNGLQHYAALLRDTHGARQVNLLPSDEPQDVYAGVRRLVEVKVRADAEGGEDDVKPLAMALEGRITRKVVKQTVMTSVYGVTFIGAKDQIQNRLVEQPGLMELPRLQQSRLAAYLAKITLASLGEVFSGATDAMTWLNQSARAITKESGEPVGWTTELGLPVTQPYYKAKAQRINTLVGQLSLAREMDPSDPSAAVDTMKQRSAFSPNFIHSIDSAHMMKTATTCRRRGLVFAAVHDSFWTHACDVDEMNQVLRDEFVQLHSEPLLEKLVDGFKVKFPHVDWDHESLKLPKCGSLDLEAVKQSTYFFA